MIRTFQKKDMLYIIHTHYQIYNKEYGYDLTFRDFITESVDGFIKRSDPKENIWILEIDGHPRGSISIKKVNENVAQLGLFLVEPEYRGSGYGKKLIEKAISFCQENNYKTIILWTNDQLQLARHLYESVGFQLVETRFQTLSNQKLLEEKWKLNIGGGTNESYGFF